MVNIYYNEKNPSLIRDKFKMNTCVLGITFLSIFLLGVNITNYKKES